MVHFTVYAFYITDNYRYFHTTYLFYMTNTLRKQPYSIAGDYPRSTLCILILFNGNAIIRQSCDRTKILNTKNDTEMLT